MKETKTKKLVLSAVLLALATVLSLFKVYQLPLGGSITLLSMLPVCLLSIRYGVKWGLTCSFFYGVIQIALSFGELMSWGMTAGIGLAMVLRFISHFISGTIFFAVFCPDGWNVVLYSICYNGSYMLPEMAFTMLGAFALFRAPQTRSFVIGAQS